MEAGFILNQYVLVEQLGEGGMAEVWKGRHTRLDYEVAVKFLKPQFAHDRDLQERFLNEGKRQAILDHPNIVRAIDFISEGSRHFLVMKYVEGGGLDRRIEEAGGPLPLEEVLNVSFQVLSALAFAHRQNIVHRDVKPSNILMDREGQCYLTDFGIALAAGQQRLTRTGTVMGTDYYMSPEQIRSPHTVDHRTDIYAFGVVLFEMLTGVLPFDYDNEFLLKQAHVEQAPPKPSKLNPLISKAVESVVLCALAKSPDDRWCDCDAMAEALELARTGARPPARKTRPQGVPTPVPPESPARPRIPARSRPSTPAGPSPATESTLSGGRQAVPWLAVGTLLLAFGIGVGARLYFISRSHRDVSSVHVPAQKTTTVPPSANVTAKAPESRTKGGADSGTGRPAVSEVPSQPDRGKKNTASAIPYFPKETKPAPRESVPKESELPARTATDRVPEKGDDAVPLPAFRPIPEPGGTPPSRAAIPARSFTPNPPQAQNPAAGNTVSSSTPAIADSRNSSVSRPVFDPGPNTSLPATASPAVVTRPTPIPREAPVRASGTLIWSVPLKKGVGESLIEMRPSSGQVQGDPLPGVPVAISISPPNAAGVVEPPSPANGWTTLKLRGLINANIVISISWKRL